MSSKSKARKKGASDSNDSNSVSSKPDRKKQPRIRWEDISSKNTTTKEPSSSSATDSVAARLPASLPGLPTFAAAAAAAAPKDPPAKKKPRRAGFREQFLQQLRVMLDRESQNNSTTVQWSADGNSFIIMDQLEFEKHIIPTYFDNPIMLSSFLSKLYRWGFRRLSNERIDFDEFCLPTFKRLGVNSAPASAAARGGNSIQVQQQQIQQVMDRMNNRPAPTQSNLSHSIADLISNIQRQRSCQQPSMSSQQPVMNQNVDANSYLQSFQQWHHSNPTMNTLNTNSSSHLAGRRQIADYFSSLTQNLSRALMSQPNNIAVLHPLVLVMQRVVEEELQHRNRVDHILNTMLSMLGQIISDRGGLPNDNIGQSQQGMIPPLMQSLVSNNNYRVGALPPSISNQNDQADSIAAILQATGWGASTPSSGGIQADLIAAILQYARTSEQTVPAAPARNNLDNEDNGDDDDDENGGVDGHLSPRNGESPDDDDQCYDADDDSGEKKIRSQNTARKKSSRK